MNCYEMNGRNGASSFQRFGQAALAALVLLGGSTVVHAVGLKYVDAIPASSFGPTNNLYQSNGAALTPTQLDPEQNVGTTNAWGWRDFGASNSIYNPDYASVYEASAEDAPEIQMRLTAADGIAAATSYDVYAVYWSDNNNWNIRAGFAPGTVATPLPIFARTNAVAGETAGSFAASAAWTVPPLDNPTDENVAPAVATDDNTNPFVDHAPGEPTGSIRNMYLGLVGSITSGSQAGATPSEIRVWLDDLSPSAAADRRTWIDGLAFVPAGTPVFVTGTVDRATGNLTINNPTTESFNIVSYSIVSAAGGLNASGALHAPWRNLTDGTLTGFTDTDNDWTIVAGNSQFSTELREQDGGLPAGAQDGIVLPGNNALPINFGNIWQRTPFEDIQVQLRIADGTPADFTDNPVVTVRPTFTGTAITAGDFNADGAINSTDYLALIGGLHVPFTTAAAAYRQGDITGNGRVDRNDVLFFRNVFDAGSGAGSFDRMVAGLGVPEPSTVLLATLASGLWVAAGRRRRVSQRRIQPEYRNMMNRRKVTHVAILAAGLLATVCFAGSASAVPVGSAAEPWRLDERVLPVNPNIDPFGDWDTPSPTVGTGAAQSADQVALWAKFPTVTLNNSQQIVLRGRVTLTGADAAGNQSFRFGLFRDYFPVIQAANPAATRLGDTNGWVGYLAGISGTANDGRLDAKNPDNTNWLTDTSASPISTNSTSNYSGPASTACTDAANAAGTPGNACGNRVFNLAAGGGTSAFGDGTYDFNITVGRYGNEVTVQASMTEVGVVNPVGDYNNDGNVNAADYTVWRNNLGTAFALPNRAAANMGNVSTADYDTWKTNFGLVAAPGYTFNLGGGIDFNGNPPPVVGGGTVVNPENGQTEAYTPHLTFSYDRVEFLFADHLNADLGQLQNVDVSTEAIETISLNIAANGSAQLVNTSTKDFDMIYYEITSTAGSLISGTWDPFDPTPLAPPDGVGWNVAGGSGPNVLSEVNLTGTPQDFSTATPVGLGTIFNTAMAKDLRFFFAQSDGSLIRGVVNYAAGSGAGGLAVPEPGCLVLLLAGILSATVSRGRRG